MTRTQRSVALLAALICCLNPALLPASTHALAQRQARVAAPPSPNTAGAFVAIALDGVIYVVSQNGGPPRRLTAGHSSSTPQLSPDRRLIAYFTPGSVQDAYHHPKTHDVWVVPVTGLSNGSSARRLSTPGATLDRGGLSWAPDGRALAYYQGADVIVCNANGSHPHAVLHLAVPYTSTFTYSLTAGSPIAWSPDSRTVAVTLPFTETRQPPSTLELASAAIGGGMPTTSTVRFAAGILGGPSALGSHPVGDSLAWAPDGRHLTFATVHNGAGWSLTGVWQVAASGGIPGLLVGTPAGVAGRMPLSSPLYGATHFAWSPDGRHLALDPDNRLWVANHGASVGGFYNLGIPAQCRLAQYAWLTPNTIGYVKLCGIPSPAAPQSAASGPFYQLSLYSLTLATRTPRLLLRVDEADQFALSLAPQYGCIGCG